MKYILATAVLQFYIDISYPIPRALLSSSTRAGYELSCYTLTISTQLQKHKSLLSYIRQQNAKYLPCRCHILLLLVQGQALCQIQAV